MKSSIIIFLVIAITLSFLFAIAFGVDSKHEQACDSAGGVLVRSRTQGWVCVKKIDVKP